VALLAAVAVSVHLQDVDMVTEAVQQGASQPFGFEDLGPLIEGKVAGYKSRSAFVYLAEGLEEQLGAILDSGT
jgi:hypothetical protein